MPCIVLDDDTIWNENSLKREAKKAIMPSRFTELQQSLENANLKDVLKELRKRFDDEK